MSAADRVRPEIRERLRQRERESNDMIETIRDDKVKAALYGFIDGMSDENNEASTPPDLRPLYARCRKIGLYRRARAARSVRRCRWWAGRSAHRRDARVARRAQRVRRAIGCQELTTASMGAAEQRERVKPFDEESMQISSPTAPLARTPHRNHAVRRELAGGRPLRCTPNAALEHRETSTATASPGGAQRRRAHDRDHRERRAC